MGTSLKTFDLDPTHSVEEAFANILKANFNYVLSWEQESYHNTDIEGVHQMRVGMRRMRSCVVVFGKTVPRRLTEEKGLEIKWAANELGPARDLDVLITEALDPMVGKIPFPEGEAKLRRLAEEHRSRAYDQVRAMIDSPRFQTLKRELVPWLERHGWREGGGLSEEEVKGLETELRVFAAKVLEKRLKRVLEDGAHFATMTPEELHLLRIDCKKLRYATEFFSTLYDKDGMAQFVARLKELQGVLGILNDVAVMHHLLETLLQGHEEDIELAKYAGALVGWRSRQYEEVRSQLGGLWEQFTTGSESRPWQHHHRGH